MKEKQKESRIEKRFISTKTNRKKNSDSINKEFSLGINSSLKNDIISGNSLGKNLVKTDNNVNTTVKQTNR